jgi:hypothetical protein
VGCVDKGRRRELPIHRGDSTIRPVADEDTRRRNDPKETSRISNRAGMTMVVPVAACRLSDIRTGLWAAVFGLLGGLWPSGNGMPKRLMQGPHSHVRRGHRSLESGADRVSSTPSPRVKVIENTHRPWVGSPAP